MWLDVNEGSIVTMLEKFRLGGRGGYIPNYIHIMDLVSLEEIAAVAKEMETFDGGSP